MYSSNQQQNQGGPNQGQNNGQGQGQRPQTNQGYQNQGNNGGYQQNRPQHPQQHHGGGNPNYQGQQQQQQHHGGGGGYQGQHAQQPHHNQQRGPDNRGGYQKPPGQHQQQHQQHSGAPSNRGGGRYQGRGGPGGGQSFNNSPQKMSHSVVPKGPINLITNNFRIRSQNHGIIHTYAVSFIERERNYSEKPLGEIPLPPPEGGAKPESNPEEEDEETKQMTANSETTALVANFGADSLETFQKYKILGAHAAKLKGIFMQYISVGNNIFSTTQVDDKIDFETTKPFFGRHFTIVIERVSEFALDELNTMKMEQHPFALSFVNSIIKTQMRNSKLCQIGRNPRFFMPQQAKTFENAVQTWPGFFTSSWIFQRGLYLIIDNISKNLSVDDCLKLIKEQIHRFKEKRQRFMRKPPNQKEISQAVNEEFKGAIVMARYGQHKTYKVSAVKWDMTPQTCEFEQGEVGKTISMVLYFQQQYDVQIIDLTQPLFEIKQKRQNIYLPPELCTLVGIPQRVRENKKIMASMRQSLFQKPHDRIKSICNLNAMIAHSKEVKQWGLEIDLTPDTIEASVLERPKIFETPNFQQQTTDPRQQQEGGMRRNTGDEMPTRPLENSNCLNSMVHEPQALENFAIFCLQRDEQNARYINEKFYDMSIKKGLDIFVEYADICLIQDWAAQNEDELLKAFAKSIQFYYNSRVQPHIASGAKSRFIFLVIMPDHSNHQDFYSFLKNKINCEAPVISQFVANRTITKYNDRIFMNIIRQMNAKIGGDLWRMSFGPEISKATMLVGIDVCHKGKQSTIGFCATYDPYLCKYYAQAAPQPQKGQEIISTSVLSDYFQRAFQSYRDFNDSMPEHIFIYRDGVGDSMRQMVVDEELNQLHKIVAEEYGIFQQQKDEANAKNAAGPGEASAEEQKNEAPVPTPIQPPKITLIIVNKRVRQRFFQQRQTAQGNEFIQNPPQGTYIDAGFVEQSEVKDGKFDFFLVPHSVTQGSVKPTHFYVAENSSAISKAAILNFTYALCYNYYNWNDAIKIPAPCMLADKIAGFRSEVGTIPSNVDLHKLPFYL